MIKRTVPLSVFLLMTLVFYSQFEVITTCSQCHLAHIFFPTGREMGMWYGNKLRATCTRKATKPALELSERG